MGDTLLAVGGLAGLVTAAFFSVPTKLFVGITGTLVAAGGIGIALKSFWVSSQADEWLLIIKDGKCVKAGIGLKCFVGPTEMAVKYLSRVERISFSANNVTMENQGIIIKGFAFWSVYREGQGPYRCYKCMQDGRANENVQALCESALRNLIANTPLNKVLRSRKFIKEQMQKDLQKQLKGWGIWLESVEITEITIESENIFHDLQAQFRQEVNYNAQKIEMETKQITNQIKQGIQLCISQKNQYTATEIIATKNRETIIKENQNALYAQKKNEIEIERIERESQFKIQDMKFSLLKQEQAITNSQLIQNKQQDFEQWFLTQKINLDKQYDEMSLLKYNIDSTERIYNRLNLKDVKINQFVDGEQSNLLNILPKMDLNQQLMQ